MPCLLSEVQAGGTLLQCVPGPSRDTWNGPGIPFKDSHSWWNVDLWVHHRFSDINFIEAKLQSAVGEVHIVHFTEWLTEWHDRWICCIHFLGDSFKGIILVINQLDAQNFTISLFHVSTCFEHHVLIIRRSKLHYTASGIITLKWVV